MTARPSAPDSLPTGASQGEAAGVSPAAPSPPKATEPPPAESPYRDADPRAGQGWRHIPEIADYEFRHELLRAGARAGLGQLDNFAVTSVYDPVTTPILREAAEFWADLGRRGLPTAADESLDADAILAAQAALIASEAPGIP